MKYRQETVAEKDWDGELDTYDEWSEIWTTTDVQECDFSRCSRSTLHYSARFCPRTGRWGVPGEVSTPETRKRR